MKIEKTITANSLFFLSLFFKEIRIQNRHDSVTWNWMVLNIDLMPIQLTKCCSHEMLTCSKHYSVPFDTRCRNRVDRYVRTIILLYRAICWQNQKKKENKKEWEKENKNKQNEWLLAKIRKIGKSESEMKFVHCVCYYLRENHSNQFLDHIGSNASKILCTFAQRT